MNSTARRRLTNCWIQPTYRNAGGGEGERTVLLELARTAEHEHAGAVNPPRRNQASDEYGGLSGRDRVVSAWLDLWSPQRGRMHTPYRLRQRGQFERS
jgi:hypothetical protein